MRETQRTAVRGGAEKWAHFPPDEIERKTKQLDKNKTRNEEETKETKGWRQSVQS
jgi:hypothetical protein